MEQWAEIRRMFFVEGLSIKGIARKTGRDRKTIRKAISGGEPSEYRRVLVGSKLDPYRERIARLLRGVEGINNPPYPGADLRSGLCGIKDDPR